ncbi:ef hand family protein [Stylonychia lemnae]|uniref:Calmodulin n=1 Tax=Stylonychia lemnae TaxID=5949 RepID=A0A077ZSR8_STYLE|nr:ef hand family protein [Stylonychia lemnae]|eukprot:CDW72928.1 ef hand family protein [Stylonychia lemnae]
MSSKGGDSFRDQEEEKRRFDSQIYQIEKKMDSKYEKGDGSSKNNSEKNNYELMEQQLDLELSESSLMSKMERKKQFVANMQAIQDKKQRQWLIKHGKGYLLDFQDQQIRKLKECFGSLDGDGSGSIGIEELEEPLIGLGFADTRDEVQEMVDAVDEDGSGQIEFPEFLSIIKNSDGNEKMGKINKFFKDMTSGQLAGNDLSFNLLVQKLRRDYLMDAIMSGDVKKKEFGEKILRNVSKQVQAQKFKNKFQGNS